MSTNFLRSPLLGFSILTLAPRLYESRFSKVFDSSVDGNWVSINGGMYGVTL